MDINQQPARDDASDSDIESDSESDSDRFFSSSSSDGEHEPQPRGEEHYRQIGEGLQVMVVNVNPNAVQAGPAQQQMPVGAQATAAAVEHAPRFVPDPRNDPINNPTIVGILDEADAEMALERAQAVGQIVNEIDNFRVLAYINY